MLPMVHQTRREVALQSVSTSNKQFHFRTGAKYILAQLYTARSKFVGRRRINAVQKEETQLKAGRRDPNNIRLRLRRKIKNAFDWQSKGTKWCQWS